MIAESRGSSAAGGATNSSRRRDRQWHAEKVGTLRSDLEARGLSKRWAAPPLYVLLWFLRIPVRPPLFQRFGALLLTMGGWFCVSWGLMMWLFSQLWFLPTAERAGVTTIWLTPFIALLAVGAGTFFGLTMAALVRRKARPLHLPPWEQYPAEVAAEVFS